MKVYKITLFILSLFVLVSCYNDDSTLADNDIKSISVETAGVNDSIYLQLGDHITIDPLIETTDDNLNYAWGIGDYELNNDGSQKSTQFENISVEKGLDYKTTALGHYILRLTVTGEDGSTVKYFDVFVDSDFEEGFLILGKKANGHGSLSFMKTLTPDEVAAGLSPEFKQNMFSYVNADKELYLDPVGCNKVGDYVFIMCGESQKLVQIDAKTFQEVYEYDIAQFEGDVVPLNLLATESSKTVYASSANGSGMSFDLTYNEMYLNNDLPQETVFEKVVFNGKWEYCYRSGDKDRLWAYGYDGNWGMTTTGDYFVGRTIENFFFDGGGNLLVFNNNASGIYLTKIAQYINSFSTREISIVFEKTYTSNTTFNEESKVAYDDLYSCIFFSNTNALYKWTYESDINIPDTPFIQLDASEEIRQISVSDDDTEIYIATYNANRAEFKGSFYIYNADTGALVNKYEGISDDPVAVFYKNK